MSNLPEDDKSRKALPMWTYMMEYFPDAFFEEVRVAVVGNDQHNPGAALHWAREKSKDQMNTAFRHMWDHARGVVKDTDGTYHLAKAIWRLKAELQLTIEKERSSQSGANSRGAVVAGSPLIAAPAKPQEQLFWDAPKIPTRLAEPNHNHQVPIGASAETGPCCNPRCWCRQAVTSSSESLLG